MFFSQPILPFYFEEESMSNRIVHFEVMAENPVRAVEFYTKVFGWQISKWDGPQEYWLVTTGKDTPGIDGGIAKSEDQPSTINTIDVASVDEMAQKVLKHGGRVVVPKMPVPGVGYLVYCQDTEGIVFGMMQMDTSAQ
jgi:predicted enzyme related to lactoylglutathione lyase